MELLLLLANIAIIVFILSEVLAGLVYTPAGRVVKVMSIPLLCIAYGALMYWADDKSLGLSTIVLLSPATVTLLVVVVSYLRVHKQEANGQYRS